MKIFRHRRIKKIQIEMSYWANACRDWIQMHEGYNYSHPKGYIRFLEEARHNGWIAKDYSSLAFEAFSRFKRNMSMDSDFKMGSEVIDDESE